jgi:hypothetical protein
MKRRCATMMDFKSFRNAAATLAGIELAHLLRKRQSRRTAGNRRAPKYVKAARCQADKATHESVPLWYRYYRKRYWFRPATSVPRGSERATSFQADAA